MAALGPGDRTLALQTLAERLNSTDGRWRVEGEAVRTDGTPVIRVGNTCDMTGVHDDVVHIDVEFALNPANPATIILDCATGFLSPRERAVVQAIDFWMATTAPALLTLLRQGRPLLNAVHLRGSDPEALPGWHCISGPHVVFAGDEDRDMVLEHVAKANLLSRLAHAFPEDLGRPQLNGLRMSSGYGGASSMEVRINGQHLEGASQALAALAWPNIPRFWMFRQFVLLLSREPGL